MDLQDIKKSILEENRIEELLKLMECQNIRYASNRYEAQLPTKFDSSNSRSVQVYESEYLSCRIRSKGVSNIDIYGLVSYLVFDCFTDSEINNSLYKSKKWICEKLGYGHLNSTETFAKKKDDPLKWLKDIKKKRVKQREFSENEIYPDSILEQFIMYPYLPYIEKGLNYETQIDFQVGFDLRTERVIFPIHNQYGDIVSIKGRTIDPLYKEKGIYKFLYLYNFNKMIELYNWHNALFYILEKREVIIFEGEKSCWYATQFGFKNTVAVGGDDLSTYQVNMIKKLGLEVKIIIAFDKDKTVDDITKQGQKFGRARNVFALYDTKKLLSDKDSPVDRGENVFNELYNNKLNIF